jgi:hypothetical protein
MFFTAVQAAAGVDSGRSGGFPAVCTPVIACLLQLFKLLPEWILDDLADFLLFGLQYLPAAISAVILRLLQLSKLLSEWILDDLVDFLMWTAVIVCVFQLFKLLPEWILDDLADFLLFGLQ